MVKKIIKQEAPTANKYANQHKKEFQLQFNMQILSGVILGFQYYSKAYSKVNECMSQLAAGSLFSRTNNDSLLMVRESDL